MARIPGTVLYMGFILFVPTTLAIAYAQIFGPNKNDLERQLERDYRAFSRASETQNALLKQMLAEHIKPKDE